MSWHEPAILADPTAEEVDVLRQAAGILRRLAKRSIDCCATCGHERADHLGTVEGVRVDCVGGYGMCFDDKDEDVGCMRYRAETVDAYDSRVGALIKLIEGVAR